MTLEIGIIIIIITITTLFIQYNERERYQMLSLYEGIRPDFIDLESILSGEESPEKHSRTQIEIDWNSAHIRHRGQAWTWLAEVGGAYENQ